VQLFLPRGGGRGRHGKQIMNDSKEWADRIGRRVSLVFVVCLGAFFAYAYISHYISG
jgi:hypothetical protein